MAGGEVRESICTFSATPSQPERSCIWVGSGVSYGFESLRTVPSYSSITSM